MKSVAKQPPSQGHIRDTSRRARISSQPDIREAACVCARWAGPGPTWAQADRDLTTNVASRGYSAWSNPNRHLQMAFVEGNQEVETFATKVPPSRSHTEFALGTHTGVRRTLTPRFVRLLST